jgi:hypothetical protein
MRAGSSVALRLALALPLALEGYRLVTFAGRADSWDLGSFLVNKGLAYLPAIFFLAACVLLLLARTSRWIWLGLAASGLWLVFVEVYTYHAVSAPFRPSIEVALGLYAVCLALAFLLDRGLLAGRASPRRDAGGDAAS